jgi:lipid-binding SYLF domain-containing protein
MVLAAVVSVAALPAGAQSAESARARDAAEVFQALVNIPEHEVPAVMMRNAAAVAIVPNVRRAGLIIGGQRGKGVLLVRDEKGRWGLPMFVSLRGLSIGWQAGIQSADVVLFFRTRQSVERVLSGTYTLGVDASLAAGSLGRSASAVTDADLTAEIYSYARTRGVFAGLALQGASLDVDPDANAAFYGRRDVSARQVLAGTGLTVPPAAEQLQKVLAAYEKTLR